MDWYDDQAFQDEVKPATDGVLTNTSGNAQSFSLGQKHNVDRHNSLSAVAPDHLSYRYSTARTTLYSNDRRAFLRQKFNSKRLRHRIRLAQAYLRHPKFLTFKTRPRKDTDTKTGEIIWDEETENAFHNAIINIPAMGRRKKSQKGKSLGRNELIMEWILQETNKHRTRKQISSHIQTLDNLFKAKPEDNFLGVKEWGQIRKESDDPVTDSDGPEFYDNSIADMVRNWRMLQVDLTQIDLDVENALPVVPSKININDLKPDTLIKLHFEMWVSSSDKMDKALHRYTTVQSNISTRTPEPLENIQGWRTSWPGLVPLIEDTSDNQVFDIILLNASIKLMTDFPPARSKLGIGLELDFNVFDVDSVSVDSTCWHCTTHVYRKEKLESQAEHSGCLSPGVGRVKPPFESKWWAEQFTRLTEKRRHAMDSGDTTAVEVADETARKYLSNLKIMQTISKKTITAKSSEGNSIGNSIGNSAKPKRMAVLLWSFSHANPQYIGTTTWHKLIPPPRRFATNSPIPVRDLALSTLGMDTAIDTAFDKSTFGHQSIFSPFPFQTMVMPDKGRSGDELCQDEFLMDSQQSFVPAPIAYDTASVYPSSGFECHNQQAYEFNSQHLNEQRSEPFNIHFQGGHQDIPPPDLFETDRHPQYHQSLPVVPSQREWYHRIDLENRHEFQRTRHEQLVEIARRQSLMAFDTNTHKLLQEQLFHDHNTSDAFDHRQAHSAPPMQHRYQNHHHQDRPPHPLMSQTTVADMNAEDESLRQALIADTYHSTETQTHDQQTSHLLPQEAMTSPLLAPTAIRPSPHHRHSFAGVLQTDRMGGTDADAGADTCRQHDYIHLLNSLDPAHGEFLEVDPLLSMHDQGADVAVGLDVDRSHSQPLSTENLTKEPIDIGEGEEMGLDDSVQAVADEACGVETGRVLLDERGDDESEEGEWVQVKIEGLGGVEG